MDVLEADVGFPSLLVIDRGRWPSAPLADAVLAFIQSVLQEHPRAYLRGALFGEAAFGLGASGLVVPSMRGPGNSVCAFIDAPNPARIKERGTRSGTLAVPFALNNPTHWQEVPWPFSH